MRYVFVLVILLGLAVALEYITVDESGHGVVARIFIHETVPETVPEEVHEDTLRERGLHMMDRLVDVHGWTPEAAAIATGNAEHESNLRTSGKPGDGGTAHELFQWRHERFDALKKFAKSQDRDFQDFDLQVDFLDDEVTHRSKLELNWKLVTDLLLAAKLSHAYEVYGDSTTATRVAEAKKWLRTWKALHK